MYCRKCGRQIPDDSRHCPLCGTPTSGEYRPDEDNRTDAYEEIHEDGYGYSYSSPGRYQDPTADGRRQPGDRRGLAIASLVLGILSIVACCMPVFVLPAGLAGLILGILGMKSSGRGMAIAGIVLSVIGLLLGIGYLIMSLMLYSSMDWEEIMHEVEQFY